MPILMSGPCPNCGRHGHWWGKDKMAAEMMRRSKGCDFCQIKKAVIIGLILSIVAFILFRVITGMSPQKVTINDPTGMDSEQIAAVAAASTP